MTMRWNLKTWIENPWAVKIAQSWSIKVALLALLVQKLMIVLVLPLILDEVWIDIIKHRIVHHVWVRWRRIHDWLRIHPRVLGGMSGEWHHVTVRIQQNRAQERAIMRDFFTQKILPEIVFSRFFIVFGKPNGWLSFVGSRVNLAAERASDRLRVYPFWPDIYWAQFFCRILLAQIVKRHTVLCWKLSYFLLASHSFQLRSNASIFHGFSCFRVRDFIVECRRSYRF